MEVFKRAKLYVKLMHTIANAIVPYKIYSVRKLSVSELLVVYSVAVGQEPRDFASASRESRTRGLSDSVQKTEYSWHKVPSIETLLIV